MKRSALAIWVVVWVVGMVGGRAMAQDFTLTGTQHLDVPNAQYTSYDDGWLYDTSSVDIKGGGTVYNLNMWNTSTATANISGGSVQGLTTNGTSTANIGGGSVGWLWTYGTSKANVSGGSVSDLSTYGTSTTNVSGGSVKDVVTWNGSTANISGGSVNGSLVTYDTSTANISGGSVGWLATYNTSTANISGGQVKWLETWNTSTANISGGSVPDLYPYGGVTTLTGYDFQVSGGLALDGGDIVFNLDGGGTLSGMWQDGTAWSMDIPIGTYSGTVQLVTVPEPATLAFLALGGLAVIRRRCKRA